MEHPFNFDHIKSSYSHYYQQALQNGNDTLPYRDIQPWSKVLNDMESGMLGDIEELDIQLYPVYPISDTQFFHFANPFHKIAIDIVNKRSYSILGDRKVQLYKAAGWKIYTIAGRDSYLPISTFFRLKRQHDKWEFDALPDALRFQFVQKYHKDNAACLLHYIMYLHFVPVVESL
jgi:hypothetical protein